MAGYSEKIMDELVDKMVECLEKHPVYELIGLVKDAIATKEQD